MDTVEHETEQRQRKLLHGHVYVQGSVSEGRMSDLLLPCMSSKTEESPILDNPLLKKWPVEPQGIAAVTVPGCCGG